MPRRFERYKVRRGADLGDPEFWNPRLEDLDLRIAECEQGSERIEGAVEEITAVALARLNDTFTPVVEEAISRLATVGELFTSTSDTAQAIGPGSKTFLLAEGTRTSFADPEYVSIRPADHNDRGMIGQTTGYDRETGLLDVNVVLASGAGTYHDWIIRISGAPDIEHAARTDNPHGTTAAQVGAYTAAQADSAISAAVNAEVSARNSAITTAVNSEVTARNSAITSAINALKGGVSAAYDTLVEIAAELTNDATAIAGILTSLGNRLRVDAGQGLTSAQKGIGLDNLGQSTFALINGTIIESHAGNAVTFSVKTLAGATPSTADPVGVAFPDGSRLSITSALTLTLASGSSLGVPDGTPFRVWLAIVNNGGAAVLAARNCMRSDGAITGWPANGAVSTVAEGGGTATAAGNAYSLATIATARPFQIVATATYEAGLTVAGQWSASPTSIALSGAGTLRPGQVVRSGAFMAWEPVTTTSMSLVDTTVTLSLNRTSAANPVFISATGDAIATGAERVILQLHNGALPIGNQHRIAAGAGANFALQGILMPRVTASTTWMLRFQSQSGGSVTVPALGAELMVEERMA